MCESRARVCLLVCLLFTPTLGWAQQLELGVKGGYFLPAVQQFERTIVVSGPSGYAAGHFDARQNPGVVLGVEIAVWPLSNIGLDLAATVGRSDRSESGLNRTAVLSTFGVRLVGRKRIGETTFRLGVGPTLIHMGGSAYDGAATYWSLAKRTLGGATLQGDLTRTVGVLRLRLGVEDALYRVTMSPVTTGSDTKRTPLQHDLALTVGVSVPLR